MLHSENYKKRVRSEERGVTDEEPPNSSLS
jgi:hypothetical protein